MLLDGPRRRKNAHVRAMPSPRGPPWDPRRPWKAVRPPRTGPTTAQQTPPQDGARGPRDGPGRTPRGPRGLRRQCDALESRPLLTSLERERIPIPKMGEQEARTVLGIGPQKLREPLRSTSRR
eukprot:1541981-Pyramimonas_sp.AAC.1